MGRYIPLQGEIYTKETLPQSIVSITYVKVKVKNLLLSLLVFSGLILSIVLSQQTPHLQTNAAEAVTCHRCSNTEIGKWATFQTNDACPTGESNTAQPIPNTPISYEDKAECRDIQATVCTFDKFKTVPDWAKGNDSLGNGDYCGQVDGQTKPAACGDKDTGWVPGPKLELGSEIGVAGHYPNWYTPLGGKLPVAYDSHNDITRHEFIGRMGESNWSRFIRRMDDTYFGSLSAEVAQNQISTGVIIKYEILRIARESVHNLNMSTVSTNEDNNKLIQEYKDGKLVVNRDIKDGTGKSLMGQTITPQLLSSVTGFDVTSLDLTQFSAATNQERTDRMIAETTACGAKIPTPQPTASAPVSCEEHLLIPPADFKTDFPSHATTPSGCSLESDTVRNELTVCGEYWESAYCNASDKAHKDNAMFACRGWSQISSETNNDGTAKLSDDRLLLYYSNRIRTLSGDTLKENIAKYGDARGRKITWNSLMTEVKQKSIAFPNEHDNANKSREEVRNNALQAAATAFFGKSWGEVKEIERMNNCSTTWDGVSLTAVQPTPTTTPARLVLATTPAPTPTNTPTPTPTAAVTRTATPTPVSTTTQTTPSAQTQSVPSTNTTNQAIVTPTEKPTSASTKTTSGDTTIDGTIGKDSTGNYYSPSMVIANEQLYVFVIGDGGASSGKPQSDWFNAFVTSTSDGTSWSSYNNLSGTFTTPLRTSKLTAGNKEYIYVLGTGTNANTYFKSTNTQGAFARNWDSVNASTPQYTSSTIQHEVWFKNHMYSATTSGGKLTICVDKQICRAN